MRWLRGRGEARRRLAHNGRKGRKGKQTRATQGHPAPLYRSLPGCFHILPVSDMACAHNRSLKASSLHLDARLLRNAGNTGLAGLAGGPSPEQRSPRGLPITPSDFTATHPVRRHVDVEKDKETPRCMKVSVNGRLRCSRLNMRRLNIGCVLQHSLYPHFRRYGRLPSVLPVSYFPIQTNSGGWFCDVRPVWI